MGQCMVYYTAGVWFIPDQSQGVYVFYLPFSDRQMLNDDSCFTVQNKLSTEDDN